MNFQTYRALNKERTVALIEKLMNHYNVKRFLFLDDNFFVDKKRASEIMNAIIKEKFDIKLEFQGADIPTFSKMNDVEIGIFEKAGCEYIQFGVESGSERIRKLMKKCQFTNEQVIKLNKKLVNFRPAYNFIGGYPFETVEDLKKTINLQRQLKKDNLNAIFSPIFLFTPTPGTESYDLALNVGFEPPKNIEEWALLDWGELKTDIFRENLKKRTWLDEDFKKLYETYYFTNFFATTPPEIIIKRSISLRNSLILSPLYKLFCLLEEKRMSHGLYGLPLELDVLNFFRKFRDSK
jgi:radical SAM superfamily enzyme YgiQ (UPF0313 family)